MILDKKQSLEFLKEMKKNENRKPNKKEKELIKILKEFEGGCSSCGINKIYKSNVCRKCFDLGIRIEIGVLEELKKMVELEDNRHLRTKLLGKICKRISELK